MQAGEIDGKAVLCDTDEHAVKTGKDPFGLIFENGKVAKWGINGYRKVIIHETNYTIEGSKTIEWWKYGIRQYLPRDKLFYHSEVSGGAKCSLSSKVEILKKLNEHISWAKKKNKLCQMAVYWTPA